MAAYDPNRDPNFRGDPGGLQAALLLCVAIAGLLLVLLAAWYLSGQPTACEQIAKCPVEVQR